MAVDADNIDLAVTSALKTRHPRETDHAPAIRRQRHKVRGTTAPTTATTGARFDKTNPYQ